MLKTKRFILRSAQVIFGLISLITFYFIVATENESYVGITVFFLFFGSLTVIVSKMHARLGENMSGGDSVSRSTGQQIIARYDVIYKGGLPEYPTAKIGKIHMEILPTSFNFVSTVGTKWFSGLDIPFNAITDLQIVQRQVNTFEGLLGGLNSRQLNQANNIHIAFFNHDGRQLVLRLEMLSGLTVMGQAGKCREFEDRLRTAGIRDHFYSAPASSPALQVVQLAAAAPAAVAAPADVAADIPAQIEKLALLRDKGLVSTVEFDAKKTELLARM